LFEFFEKKSPEAYSGIDRLVYMENMGRYREMVSHLPGKQGTIVLTSVATRSLLRTYQQLSQALRFDSATAL